MHGDLENHQPESVINSNSLETKGSAQPGLEASANHNCINVIIPGTSFAHNLHRESRREFFPRGLNHAEAFPSGELMSTLIGKSSLPNKVWSNGIATLKQPDQSTTAEISRNRIKQKFDQAFAGNIDKQVSDIVVDIKNTRQSIGSSNPDINIYGFSRGGATATLLAHKLADDPDLSQCDINILAIDPVPGDSSVKDNHLSLPRNVKAYIGCYAQHERTRGFTPVIPSPCKPDQKVTTILVPGAHETLVGSDYSDILKDGGNHQSTLKSANFVRGFTMAIQNEWNGNPGAANWSRVVDLYTEATSEDVLAQCRDLQGTQLLAPEIAKPIAGLLRSHATERDVYNGKVKTTFDKIPQLTHESSSTHLKTLRDSQDHPILRSHHQEHGADRKDLDRHAKFFEEPKLKRRGALREDKNTAQETSCKDSLPLPAGKERPQLKSMEEFKRKRQEANEQAARQIDDLGKKASKISLRQATAFAPKDDTAETNSQKEKRKQPASYAQP